MPTSPSMQERLQLSNTSANTSMEYSEYDKLDCSKKSENDMQKSLRHHLGRSNSFYRKHNDGNKCNKRRYTYSHHDNKLFFRKRRRLSSFVCQAKFLNGGSRTDPLNLKSLADEAINAQMNAYSPINSPIPIPARRAQVEVFIPKNIHDPLNLNSDTEVEFHCIKARKRHRHRKPRREDHENIHESKDLSTDEPQFSELEISVSTNCSSPRHSLDTSLSTKLQTLTPVEQLSKPQLEIDHSKLAETGCSFSKPEEVHVQKLTRQQSSKTRIKHSNTGKFQANAEKFCYGNHVTTCNNWNYNGVDFDSRIEHLRIDFFKNKEVLDIGCNSGKLTLYIAKNLKPKRITGIDIDKKLINIAQSRLREMNKEFTISDMPLSMPLLYGPMAKVLKLNYGLSTEFPDNVIFLEANYVPSPEDRFEVQEPKYDTILCLRVTKWIHLNFGDEGLKRAFKRMYAQLRIGGQLILEPQPWFTYTSSKRITPSIYKTYCSLEMRPESFCEYLLSHEVGFSSCNVIGRSINYCKDYRQNIYLFTKDCVHSLNEEAIHHNMSPMSFHDDWISGDEHFDEASDDLISEPHSES